MANIFIFNCNILTLVIYYHFGKRTLIVGCVLSIRKLSLARLVDKPVSLLVLRNPGFLGFCVNIFSPVHEVRLVRIFVLFVPLCMDINLIHLIILMKCNQR